MAETKTTSTRSRKKSVATENIEQNTVESLEVEKIKSEKEELTKVIEQMQKQMELLQMQLTAQIASQSSGVVIKQNEDITRTVKVTSLIPNTYNLSTQPLGRGKVYTFNKFGESINIKFTDMQDILAIYANQFEKGYAVLESQKDYEDLGVGYIFDSVVDFQGMTEIVNLVDDECVEIILDMDEDLQEKVIGIIAQKIIDGYKYDYNKIKDLEEEGLEITKMVDMLKEDIELEKARKSE